MARRVFLHVGAPKTGTTALQSILARNRAELRRRGVVYPDAPRPAQLHAALDLRRRRFRGYADPQVPGAWKRLVAEVGAWDGDAIVSHELFAPATKEQAARAVDELDAEVHVVLTARDLSRQIPAMWQENVKNRYTVSYEDFLDGLRDPENHPMPLVSGFWQMHDPVGILARWAAKVPPQRVHVVLVPPAGAPRDTLWRRFCLAVDLDHSRYDASEVRANPSLGWSETEFLRTLNTHLDAGRLDWPGYVRAVKTHLAEDVLTRRGHPSRIVLPRKDFPWVARRSAQMIRDLRRARYHVVGQLQELMCQATDEAADRGPETSPEAQLSMAVDGLVGSLERVAELHREVDRLRRRAQRAERKGPR